MIQQPLEILLERTLQVRQNMFDPEHLSALRLFAGFYEGDPRLTTDIFASTLLLTAACKTVEEAGGLLDAAQRFYLERLPWLTCVVQKQRQADDPGLRRGRTSFGTEVSGMIIENGVHYALDLRMNQDASFYLDTRGLRTWLKDNASGSEVLNTFAYTGSLGVAALAGDAARILQVDRNARFLELARRSAILNHLDLGRMKLRAADVFSEIGNCKKTGQLFDLVLLDPPFFSVTEKGKVDLVSESTRLINKLRPLVKDGGRLVSINNALFLPGQEYYQSLEMLCRDGYLEIETILPVPQDVTGFADTVVARPPVDPVPFNHPTKIVIMRVRRKKDSPQ